MIYKQHLVEIWVNGNKMDLESQDALNLRFQSTIMNPTQITSTQAEYSFSFDVPCTPNNNKIFDYANNLSKLNKFHQRYNAEVIADGTIIFSGTLVLNSVKNNKYNLNLVSVKVYSLEDIFQDKTMDKIDWKIPFEGGGTGTDTIDDYNSQLNAEVTFPLVSYGVFQKSPYNTDEVADDYTSKFDIDEWNRWYVESFPPSPNMLETLRKAFETQGYTVGGDVFRNPLLTKIYMSQNLSDEQSPDYNIGNPKFGHVSLTSAYNTTGTGYQQELEYPYFRVHGLVDVTGGLVSTDVYNWENIDLYNLLDSGGTVTAQNSYMYQPYENLIVIPADGFYKIELRVSSSLSTTGNLTVKQNVYDEINREFNEQDVTIPVGFAEHTPIEIQLVRNYEDNVELIKGKQNKQYKDGNPTNTLSTNVNTYQTCYPHEDPYNSPLPTKTNGLTTKNNTSPWKGKRTSETSNSVNDTTNTTAADESVIGTRGSFGGKRARTNNHGYNGEDRKYTAQKYGYIYNDDEIMCYDQVVSEAFICGLSSLSDGVASVAKNGYSWSSLNTGKNESFYPEIGYSMLQTQEGSDILVTEQTNKYYNTYINTPISYCNAKNNQMNGYVSCIVWLNKNDILNLLEIHRAYTNTAGSNITYSTTTNAQLSITAYSNRTYDMLKSSFSNDYTKPTEFDSNLNIANFFNNETLISDWVQNIVNAYNLEIIQDGKTVTINTKKKLTDNYAAVDIDDRVNSANAEASMIDYPKSMAVKYKIDTDEWGFERSAVESQGGNESILNDEGWQQYGDSGFSTIQLNDDSYVTNTSERSLQNSYTWYQNFNWYAVNSGFTKTSTDPVTLKLPTISKYSYMIDGYDYGESMKHDGFGLPQRFWFKPSQANAYVWLRTYPTERVQIYTPSNMYTNYRNLYFNLSYKNTEPSILTEFFNINAYLASNYVVVDVYLTPDEYNRIKNGSMIHFESDLYIPVEISGYDPSGAMPTNLKMMKKVV